MAEGYYRHSPYHFSGNNPIRFLDLNGMNYGDFYKTDGTHLGSDGIDDNKVHTASSVTKNDKGIVTSAENSNELSVTHTEFTTMANVVKHESSGNKEESKWIAHTANNAKDNNAIDYKKNNTTLYDQLTDQNYSTTPASARTPLSTADNSSRANNARAAIIDVLSGNADPTGGAVLWDGDDFLSKGASHNKFKEYSSVNIGASHLQSYGLGTKNKSTASTFWAEIVFNRGFSGTGNTKSNYSLHSTGAPGKGRSIFWEIKPND
jgi:hypothetical protein